VLARFACRLTESGNALLVDVGSTTTDIVPLVDGFPKSHGLDDTQRLLAGELVYTGIGRTPICAVVRSLPWGDRQCPVAAELFAASADAYVILGDVDEQPQCTDTADQRPKTRPCARARLARMICADSTTFNDDDATVASAYVRDAQVAQIKSALTQVAGSIGSEPEAVLVSGAGEFLASRACRHLWPNTRQISLTAKIGREASQCAPAFALAVIANEAR
jgi:probable H4MPT-linked C1 transfer pathway protein